MDDASILAEELNSDSVTQRRRAARMLALLGELAKPAAISIIKNLASEDEEVRNWLTEAIENFGPPLPEHWRELAEQIRQAESSLVVVESCRLISRLGQQAAEAVPALILRLQQSSAPAEQIALMKALGNISVAEQTEEVGSFIDSLPLDDEPSLNFQRQRTLDQLDRI